MENILIIIAIIYSMIITQCSGVIADGCYELMVNNSAMRIPPNYNALLLPPDQSPMIVQIGFIVNDVLSVDDDAYTIKVKMEMPMYWNDSRLDIHLNYVEELGRWFYVDPGYKDIIWFPNLIIKNMQKFETIGSFKKTEKLMVTRIENLRLYYVAHHLVTFTCPMRFDKFPFDQHICRFEVYFDNPSNEIKLEFFHGDRFNWGWANTTTILEYTTNFYALAKHRLVKREVYFSGFTVNQTVAGFEMRLTRKVNVYVFDYYIPSGLFVVVSWVSLVIPPDAIPGRIALIITTFLVLVNIANSVFSKSPTAHTINPIQVWILACISFVFITVMEYAYVLFLIRRQRKYVLDQKKKKKIRTNGVTPAVLEKPKVSAAVDEVALGVLTTNIDHACVWVLSVLFIAFNIGYWTYYNG